jgi:hypothetical protein
VVIPLYFLYVLAHGVPDTVNEWVPVGSEQFASITVIIMNLIAKFIVFLILLSVNIVLHEFIHGITLNVFCNGKWKDNIAMGIWWGKLTPYCICLKPLPLVPFLIGGMMPCIVLGVALYALSLFFGAGILMIIGLANIVFSSGDVAIAIQVIRYKPELVVERVDSPGFYTIHASLKDKRI